MLQKRLKRTRFFAIVILFFLPKVGFSQLSVELGSSIFQSYEAITNFIIRNSLPEQVPVFIKIDLSEVKTGNVFTISVSNALLQSGANSFKSFSSQSKLDFYSTSASKYLKSNDRLPDGDYNVCYTLITKKSGVQGANLCQQFSIRNMSPLLLLHPINKLELCDDRPMFQWQNPMPMPPDGKIRLVLTELQKGQTATEAIYRNAPLVNVMDVKGSQLSLPSYVENLEESTAYAWQVIIYDQSGIVKKSEIWTFEKKCTNPVKENKDLDAFRQLKPQFDGTYYLMKNKIRFSFINSYSVEKLAYSIIDIESNKPIKYIPDVKVHTGINNIEIDVDDCRGLKKGKYYLLKVTNVNSSVLQMRFKYEE